MELLRAEYEHVTPIAPLIFVLRFSPDDHQLVQQSTWGRPRANMDEEDGKDVG